MRSAATMSSPAPIAAWADGCMPRLPGRSLAHWPKARGSPQSNCGSNEGFFPTERRMRFTPTLSLRERGALNVRRRQQQSLACCDLIHPDHEGVEHVAHHLRIGAAAL